MKHFLIKYSMKTPTFNTFDPIKSHLAKHLFILPLFIVVYYTIYSLVKFSLVKYSNEKQGYLDY